MLWERCTLRIERVVYYGVWRRPDDYRMIIGSERGRETFIFFDGWLALFGNRAGGKQPREARILCLLRSWAKAGFFYCWVWDI